MSTLDLNLIVEIEQWKDHANVLTLEVANLKSQIVILRAACDAACEVAEFGIKIAGRKACGSVVAELNAAQYACDLLQAFPSSNDWLIEQRLEQVIAECKDGCHDDLIVK